MVEVANSDRIIVNPLEKKEEKIFKNGSWMMASRPGKIPTHEIPQDDDDPYIIKKNISEFRVKLNKWGLEAASLVCGVGTIAALASIPTALTVDTIGHNFEISHAPDVTAVIALGCLGIITTFVSIFSHKTAESWRKIQGWMKREDINEVDVARQPQYWHGQRF